MKKFLFITTRIWEGAYIFKVLAESELMPSYIILQSPWWRKNHSGGYSALYWYKYITDSLFGVYGNRYYPIIKLAKRYNIPVIEVKDINKEVKLLEKIDPDLIVIAGSPILGRSIIDKFRWKIINFHTGILPQYRGPYSEFWAIYNHDKFNIGTTIHFLDEGVDSGDIIQQRHLNIDCKTPEECHVMNVKMGVVLLNKVINNFWAGKIISRPQNSSDAKYYSHPTEQQLFELEKRIGKKIKIKFGE